MPTLEEILHAIGSGIGTAGKVGGQVLGTALTPPAMLLAARAGRSPFSALPGYTPPMTDYQKAQLANMQQQQQFNQSLLGALGLGGEGVQSPAAPQGVAGQAGGILADATAGPRHTQALTPPAAPAPQRLTIKGVSVGAGGKPSVNFEVPKTKVKVYDAGTINPATGQEFVSGEADPAGDVAMMKLPKPTERTRAMAEAAPKVKKFVADIRKDMAKIEQGPFASRWQEAMTSLGVSNPEWATFRTDVSLLSGLLSQMHYGARGAQAFLQRIDKMLGAGIQSPDNMAAALDVLDKYSDDLMGMGKTPTQATAEQSKAFQESKTPGMGLREQFDALYGGVSRADGGGVMPGQTAVVGERGPELAQFSGGARITPLGGGMPVQDPSTQIDMRQLPVLSGLAAQAQPMQAMRLQAAGAPEQQQARKIVKQATPDQLRGAAYAGGTPTTTIPGGGIGVGQGLTPADAAAAQQMQNVRIIQGPNGPMLVR